VCSAKLHRQVVIVAVETRRELLMNHLLDLSRIVRAPLSRVSAVLEHTCWNEHGWRKLAQPELELLIFRASDLLTPPPGGAKRLGSEQALTRHSKPAGQHLGPHGPLHAHPDVVSAPTMAVLVEGDPAPNCLDGVRMCAECAYEVLECSRHEPVVVVQEKDELPADQLETTVARRRPLGVRLEPNSPYARIPRRE
jgi:hypothetical protein